MSKLRTLLILLLLAWLPVLAQDEPNLTKDGLEDFYLGQLPPESSRNPALSYQRFLRKQTREGSPEEIAYLDISFQHHVIAQAILDPDGTIREIVVSAPGVYHEHGFAVGLTWEDVQRVTPNAEVFYTYVSDRIVVDHVDEGNTQLLFTKSDYIGSRRLEGEHQKLGLDDIRPRAVVRSMRTFK
ncbi:MAG: hypothetical protein AB7S38_17785 [Vulcanimicrobiota bacterium]